MKILITGGTGFVGGCLWRALKKEGHTIRLLVRDPSAAPAAEDGLEIVEGDITRPETLDKPTYNIDAIIHCAALMADKDFLSYEEFERVNIEGTRALLNAAASSARPRFIHISTTLVTGPSNGNPTKVTANIQTGGSHYTKSKAAAEQLVRRSMLPWTILRLPPLYGPGMRHGWPDVLRRLKQGTFKIIGNGSSRMHLTHIDDIVAGVLNMFESPQKTDHQIYQLAGPEPIELGKAFQLLAHELGAPEPGRIPIAAARWAARILQFVPAILKPKDFKLLSPHRVEYFSQDYVYDTTQAQNDFGYAPKIAPEKGLVALAKDFHD
jgi:nucleoside-diphosphate-sugar epimerase